MRNHSDMPILLTDGNQEDRALCSQGNTVRKPRYSQAVPIQQITGNTYCNKFMKNMLYFRRLQQQFRMFHFEMINDKASAVEYGDDMNTEIDHSIFKFMRNVVKTPLIQLQIAIQRLPLLFPDSIHRIYWDILASIARLYFLYTIPIDLAWSHEQLLFEYYRDVTTPMLIIMIADMILSVNTAYYQHGQIVTDRKQILINYIKRHLGLDWISIIIMMVFYSISGQTNELVDINTNTYYILLLLFLIHHLNIYEVTSNYEQSLNLSKHISSYLELLKLLLVLFYLIHLFSCLWYWAGVYSLENQEASWLGEDLIGANATWGNQYMASFYFTCVTMFTVGYGDITPKSKLEKQLVIVFILISSIQLPYSVNTVGSIIDKLSHYRESNEIKFRTINGYMQRKNVPYQLQYSIRQYLQHYWESETQQESQEERSIISQLSENLREKLIIQANSPILDQSPLFKNYFSQKFKQQLLKSIKQYVIQPESLIQLQDIMNTSDGIYICFIDEGEIEVFIDQGANMKLSTVSQGQTLGMSSFISGKKAIEKYKSVGFTKVLILSRDDFINTLREYPQDNELFCRIKDDIMWNPDSGYFQLGCFSCNSKTHKLISCPMLHYVPEKELIIKRHIYHHEQNRRHFQRRNHRRRQQFNIDIPCIGSQQFINTLPQPLDIIQHPIQINTVLHQQSPFIKIPQQQMQVVVNTELSQNGDRDNNSKTLYRQPQGVFEEHIEQIEYHQQTIKEQIEILEYRQKNIKQIKNNGNTIIYNKQLQEIELEILKLKNIKHYERKHMKQFEIMHNYHTYFPNNNNKMIINNCNRYQNEEHSKKLSQYLKYLLYPGQLLRRFQIRGFKQYQQRDRPT